jgi:hypothetical protein
MLNAEERAILLTYCSDHQVAKCIACTGDFKLSDLAVDALGGPARLCPWCRRDLTDSIRTHIYGCALLPEEIRRRGELAREAGQRLLSESDYLSDTALVLMRKSAAAQQAFRETLRQSVPKRRE